MLARRFQVDQHGHPAAELVEAIEIDADAATRRDRRQMNQSIAGTADSLQDDQRIAERLRSELESLQNTADAGRTIVLLTVATAPEGPGSRIPHPSSVCAD